MSQRKIKKNGKSHGGEKPGPLDWIRTDDKSMVDCFYILLMTRGFYSVVNCLANALDIEAESSRNEKVQYHPGWIRNAEFCEEAKSRIGDIATELRLKWDRDDEDDIPVTARIKEPHPGGFYPLPGGGLYIPK